MHDFLATTIIIPSKNFFDPYLLLGKIGLLDLYKSFNIIFVFSGTAERSDKVDFSKIVIIENSNSGIYHAYNTAIGFVRTEYYMIVGDDDFLVDDEVFLNILSNVELSIYDIYILGVIKGGKAVNGFFPAKLEKYIFGSFPSHSGGMIIRKTLHKSYGDYKVNYKRLADQLFFNLAFRDGVSVLDIRAIAFKIGSTGFSSNYSASLFELYRMNLEFGFVKSRFLFVRYIYLYVIRLLKRIKDL